MYQINFSHPISIHFIGIGGISMSGLAEILMDQGFSVSGSDAKPSPLTKRLAERGAVIYYGQRAENLNDSIDLVVYTSAIHPDNPEYIAMQEKGIPSLTRAQLLGQIMKNYELPIAISGTHGKTTTTSMISEILLEAGTDPTLSIGGILKAIGGNIRIGHGSCFVTEACEYTNSFLSFFPKISVILNVEEDHLDFFKDITDIRNSFHRFAALLPEDGTLIINGEIPEIGTILDGLNCRIITYGGTDEYDYHPEQISYQNGCADFLVVGKNGMRENISLSVPGRHNIDNALAAIALADLFAIDFSTIRKALFHFHGTDRRFEYKGKVQGVTIIDDYAHHPTEITATLSAAQNYAHKTLWCVFQPHTFSRTKAFMKEFAKALSLADRVVLTDIYPARETDDLGISSKTLKKEIEALGKTCYYFPSFEEIENFLLKYCTQDDLLITMGAGDVLNIGENLLKQ
ncbi:UDP-N-acetylmuramate--L-alanine ligase [Parablautia muri]|uniref:UDP-N-acetylmuramate--L-alanine ligase n=1 Tax=Parablautia muri TaxID=2320879 RepID=A0A9X5GQ99_9FIRM|nr:UDP-N-acetylmuramate--L-alanine ligase [Parablautia muri]NBJ91913.1 UDP-N-acetylmuramate--L-alanine ligase [Parablautia muri]